VLLACLLLQACGKALAQGSQIRSEIDSRAWEAEAADEAPWSLSSDDKEKKFLLVPVPIVDPTIGNGLALAGLYTFEPDGDAEALPKERRSTIAVGAAYTNTDGWIVGGGVKLHLDQDRYRVNLGGGYADLKLKWYGTSSDSPFFDNPINFRTQGGMIDGNVEKRVTEHFYLGISGRYIRPTASVKIPIPELPDQKVSFDLTAVGAIGEYDSRDNTWYPASGTLGTVNILAYLEALGSDREFATVDASFAVYRKLVDLLVLAGEARVATVGDNTPFFMLSTINLRGFPRGQYMNRTVTQVQAELRWEAWRRVGVVFFGGTGVATRSLDRWGSADRAYGYGTGLRYRVSEVDKMNVGLDVATGSTDDFTVYFRIGEAF
jgi:outer membrane protein assembly factor BamA